MKRYRVIITLLLDAEDMDDVLDKTHSIINPLVIPESCYAQQITEITKPKSVKEVFRDDCPIKGLKKD